MDKYEFKEEMIKICGSEKNFMEPTNNDSHNLLRPIKSILYNYCTNHSEVASNYYMSYERALNLITFSKPEKIFGYHFRGEYLIVTPEFKLGFSLGCGMAEYGFPAIYYEDKHGTDIHERFNTISQLCDRANELTDGKYSDMFDDVKSNCTYADKILDFYRNHVYYNSGPNFIQAKIDSELVFERPRYHNEKNTNWLI